jgi:hypothetical protein
MAADVLTTARSRDRSLNQARGTRTLRSDPQLLLWRRMIEFSVAEAKKTVDGLPTDLAILARWWIADFQPNEREKDEWERSFACACQWLDLDAAKERKKRLREIDSCQRSPSSSYCHWWLCARMTRSPASRRWTSFQTTSTNRFHRSPQLLSVARQLDAFVVAIP